MSRTSKTPKQRAQEAVDVLDRRLTKLRAKQADARNLADDLERQIEETELRLEYAEQNPDLQHPATSTGATA